MSDLARKFLSGFNRFSPEEIELIIQNTCVEQVRKGELIIQEGKIAKKCYFVVHGCLRQYQTKESDEKTRRFYVEGDPVVLYSSYLHSAPSEYSVQCLEDCTLISGTREAEQKMHAVYPALEYLTHTIMMDDYRKAEEYITLLNSFNAEQRYSVLSDTRPDLFNRIPLLYIASYLGVTPESLSRIRKRVQAGAKN